MFNKSNVTCYSASMCSQSKDNVMLLEGEQLTPYTSLLYPAVKYFGILFLMFVCMSRNNVRDDVMVTQQRP